MPPSPIRSRVRKQSSGGRGMEVGGRPSKILFVEDLTETICETLPDFWRLGKAYFSGSLFQGVMLTENQQMLAKNCGMNQARFEVGGVQGGCSLVRTSTHAYTHIHTNNLGQTYALTDTHIDNDLGGY